MVEDDPKIPRGKLYLKIDNPLCEPRFLRRFYRFNKEESTRTFSADPDNPNELKEQIYRCFDLDFDAVVRALRLSHLEKLRAKIQPLALAAGIKPDRFDDWLFAVLPFFDLDEGDKLVAVEADGTDAPTPPADLIAEMATTLASACSGEMTLGSPRLPDGKVCKKNFSREERLRFIGEFGVAAWMSVPTEAPSPLGLTNYLMQSKRSGPIATTFARER